MPIAALRRHLALLALLGACLALLPAAVARAQTPGTDCGCAATGDYVEPDPGVALGIANAATGLSPGGRYRVVVTSGPGQTPPTLDVRRVSGDTTLVQGVSGVQWGFSPDDDRFAIVSLVGAPPNQQFEYALYDLAAGAPAPRIWHDGPTPWSSARIRFSADGAVFLFAGYNQTVGTDLQLLAVASRSLFHTSFSPSSPPGDLDDDADVSVAGWGFGPDPTRFVYAYVSNSGAGTTAWGRVNVATRVVREETFTANSMYAVFSPCGDAIAFVVKQLATSDLTDVYLHGTADPLAGALGATQLPFPALQVQVTASQHEVLQGGTPNRLADNHAGDACAATNRPPVAGFDVPSLTAGTAGTFTDTSTDPDGQIVAWAWDFGDGATSSSRNPSHGYAATGTFRVRLTVTDDGGATDSIERTVTVCGSVASLAGRLLLSGLSSPGDSDLYVFNTDDGSTVRLTNRADTYSTIRDARFSPDGMRIAYTETGFALSGIWVMNADGSQRRRLTDGGGSNGDFDFHDQAMWSPDGQWIAFRSNDVTTAGAQAIWMVRADGSGLARVPNTAFGDFPSDFAKEIAPGCGGQAPAQRDRGCYTIVFSRATNPGAIVARIRGDGTGFLAATPVGSWGLPRVSPDGAQIAFSRFLGLVGPLGGAARIFTRDHASGSERPITGGGDDFFEFPVWSPDGGAIAYSYSVEGIPGSITNREIGVSDGMGCTDRSLVTGPGHQIPRDWAPGHATQGLGSIAGRVALASNYRASVAGAVVAISGDVSATTTADANGEFRFENLPIGANVTIRFVSAPGYVASRDLPSWSVAGLVGHTVGAIVRATPDTSPLSGTIRSNGGAALGGVTVTATGPNGTVVGQTNAGGSYALSLATYETYTVAPSLAGWRFEPPSASITAAGSSIANFTGFPLPPAGRVAFVRTGHDGLGDILTADLDGAHPLNLTALQAPGDDRDPAWSPDGTRIAFTSDRDGSDALWTMGGDGADPTPLGVDGHEPAWSPDGAQIAFATDDGLRLLTLDSGDVQVLTTNPTDASPRFRTDGLFVTFERLDASGDTNLFLAIPGFVGADLPFAQVNSMYPDLDPAWGREGFHLAYVLVFGSPTPTHWIILRDLATGDYRQIVPGDHPTWSPDGRWVAYDDGRGAIWRVDPNDPLARQQPVVQSGTDRDPDWAVAEPPCANGIDDDRDGAIDSDDPGCDGADDPSERSVNLACDDTDDDDGDGFAAFPQDTGCTGPLDPSEVQDCFDGLDNDGDGRFDFADDGCFDALDETETIDCANGLDDDRDGLVDTDDPGCADASDGSERTDAPGCDNGYDDDGDGFVDLDDPGCASAIQPIENPLCDNGYDDDGDGLVDADDPTCQQSWPFWESAPRCGVGAELVLVLAALARWRRRVA